MTYVNNPKRLVNLNDNFKCAKCGIFFELCEFHWLELPGYLLFTSQAQGQKDDYRINLPERFILKKQDGMLCHYCLYANSVYVKAVYDSDGKRVRSAHVYELLKQNDEVVSIDNGERVSATDQEMELFVKLQKCGVAWYKAM